MASRGRRALGRALRLLGRLLAGLGLVAVFAVSLVVGLVLHVDASAGRRIATRSLNVFLSDLFQGQVSIGSIDHLSPYSVRARNLVVRDTEGRIVLKLSQVRGRADGPEIVRQLLFGGQKISLVINHVRVERAETHLIPDPETGAPTLISALTPKPSPPSTKAEPPSERHVRVWMPAIEIGRAWGRGPVVEGGPVTETALANVLGSVLVSPKGAAIDVKRFGMNVKGLGGADARGTGTLHIRAPGPIWTRFDGYYGDIQVGAHFRADGDQLSARVELPNAEPEQVRAVLPEWPLLAAVRGRASANGELPVLQTSGRFQVGNSEVSANGPLRLSGTTGIDLEATGRDVDLQVIFPEAPKTAIDVNTALSVWSKKGEPVVDFNGTTKPTRIANEPVPAIDVTGRFEKGILAGEATLHEPGVPLHVDFEVHPDGVIDLKARTRSFSLANSPRIRKYTDARGQVKARATARIADGQLTSEFDADVAGFAMADMKLEAGQVVGTARGPIAEPEKIEIDIKLIGKGGRAGDLAFDDVEATARGTVRRPEVSASLKDRFGPNIDATGTVRTDTPGGPRIENLDVRVERGGAVVSGKVKKIDLAGRDIDIQNLELTGAGGTLRGSVRLKGDDVDVNLKGEDVDLDVLARALNLPRGTVGGKLRIDADVRSIDGQQQGHVELALGEGTINHVSGLALRLNADLNGEKLTGDAMGQVRDYGAFGAVWDTQLAGPITDGDSWKNMLGVLEVHVSQVDLGQLANVMPPEARIEQIEGTAFGQIRLERNVPAALPSVFVVAATQGLQVVQAAPKDDPEATPLHVQNIDLQIGGSVNGETGDTSATARLVDPNGVLLSASTTLRADLPRAIENPSGLPEQLQETPLNAVWVFPDRPLTALPEPIRPAGFSGVVGGRVALSGTIREPRFSVMGHALGIAPTGSRNVTPLDLGLTGTYDKTTGEFGGNAEVMLQGGRRVALFNAQGNAPWNKLTGPDVAGEPSWTGEGQLRLEGLPLAVIGPLSDNDITGELYGTVAMQRQEELPLLSAFVDVKNATIDTVPVGDGRFAMRADGKMINARLSFDDQRGKLDAQLMAQLRWDGTAPSVDDSRPVVVSLDAQNFDAIILKPALSDVLSELSGNVNASLRATLSTEPNPEKEGESQWTGKIRGRAAMQEGIVQFTALGLELRDVSFEAEATGERRRTVIRVRDMKARARSEEPNVLATADLYLDGLTLDLANANLTVDDMPVLIQGVSQARATGQASIRLERKPELMDVQVDLPDLTARLPRSSGRTVIDLEENGNIEVLQPLRKPTRPSSGGDSLPWQVTFNLGEDVLVLRNDLSIPVRGHPVLRLDDEVSMSGSIQLEPGGRVSLQGKAFVIESGEIIFDTGDPGNPRINIRASWRAPDLSTVYVSVYGTVEEPKLRLSSDPARPEPEIWALLLGSGAGGGTLAAGQAATQLNNLLEDTPLGAVEFRVASGEGYAGEERASYVAAVRLSDEVWFEGTYREQTGQTGTDPYGADISGAVDWRFEENWSLRTEIGRLGTGVDLLWQYRY